MKKIVVVDDNKMFLETLKDFVEGMNKDFKCIAFSNPEDALRYAKDEKEPSATRESMLGDLFNIPLKPLIKNFLLITITIIASNI